MKPSAPPVVPTATASYGQDGHGIVLQLHSPVSGPLQTLTHNGLKVNVFGDVWKAAPAGVEAIAKWSFLPMSIYVDCNLDKWGSMWVGGGHKPISFELGAKTDYRASVLHTTIDKVLDEAVAVGDSPFVLEFTVNSIHVFDLYTKPSLIQQSLKTGSNLSLAHPPKISRSTFNPFMYIRWWFFPTIFAALMLALFLNSALVLSMVPAVWNEGASVAAFHTVLPPHPKTMLHTWELSRLEYQLTLEERKSNPTKSTLTQILTEAAKVVARDEPLTSAELHAVVEYVVDFEENNMSVFQRVYGFFTFVNIMWVLAIIGITVSIGPALWVILRPIRELFGRLCLTIMKEIVLRLHSWGFFELCAYVVCSLLVIEGFRHPTDRGYFIGFTGLVLILPAYAYSSILHAKVKLTAHFLWISTSLWCVTWWVPMVLAMDSTLLAWFVCSACYIALWTTFDYLSEECGRKNDDIIICFSLSSFLVILAWLGLSLIPETRAVAKLFGSPVTVIGAFQLLGTLLTYSNYWWHAHSTFLLRQIPFWVAIFFFYFVGAMINRVALLNTATGFVVLYAFDKYVEFHSYNNWNGWVLVLVVSLGLWQVALYLHSNPELIRSVFL